MKKLDIFLWLTALILTGLLVQGRHKLSELRFAQQDPSNHYKGQPIGKQESAGKFRASLRASPEDDRAAAEKLIADWRDANSQHGSHTGRYSPEDTARRKLAKLTAFERLRRIDPEHWAYIIDNFPTFEEQEKTELLNVMLDTDPRKLIDALINSSVPELPVHPKFSALREALKSCAEKDPFGMADWMIANSSEYPEMLDNEQKLSLLSGISKANPGLALQTISKLDMSDDRYIRSAIDDIFGKWDDTEPPIKKLEAIRTFRKSMGDRNIYYGSSYSAILFEFDDDQEKFPKIINLMESANLSQDELEIIAGQLRFHIDEQNAADWISWVNNQPISEASRTKSIESIMQRWAREFPQDASNWMKMNGDIGLKKTALPELINALKNDYEDINAFIETLPSGELRNYAEQYVSEKN